MKLETERRLPANIIHALIVAVTLAGGSCGLGMLASQLGNIPPEQMAKPKPVSTLTQGEEQQAMGTPTSR